MSRAAPEIYVQPFPGPGSKWPISTNGGSQVRWRRDGKELFYVALDGRLMAVSFEPRRTLRPPKSARRWRCSLPRSAAPCSKPISVTNTWSLPTAQRFLVATVTEGANSPITVILNWKPRR